MADLLVKEAELKQLQDMINELPTKFGVPMLNFFNGVANLRAQEAEKAVKAEQEAKADKDRKTPDETLDPVE
jgi:hypothetical protein